MYRPCFDSNGVLTRIDTYQFKEAPMSRALWLFLLGRVNQYQLLTLSNFSHYQFNNLSIVSDDLFPRGSQLKTLVESIPANERFLKTRVYSLYETLRDFCELLPFFCFGKKQVLPGI